VMLIIVSSSKMQSAFIPFHSFKFCDVDHYKQ